MPRAKRAKNAKFKNYFFSSRPLRSLRDIPNFGCGFAALGPFVVNTSLH